MQLQDSDPVQIASAGSTPAAWKAFATYASFVALFGLLSPIYYLNKWDFRRHKTRNPFYTSKLMRVQERFPALYDLSMWAQNFPMWDRLYRAVPTISGDVLQVGCGTGLFNHYLRRTSRGGSLNLVNLDANLRALRYGARRGRYQTYVHALIDRGTGLDDASFDIIVFARSFHHIRNHKRAFAECARLLRWGGSLIIFDPIMLTKPATAPVDAGYMGNSSIDGVIWRFTPNSFIRHLHETIPETLEVSDVRFVRQLHVSNYNTFVRQTDVIAVLTKRSKGDAGENYRTDRAG
jgi:SAM-dependent methyltransferase